MRERQRTCRECLGLPPVSTLDGVVESESKREGPIVVAIYNADLVVPAPAKDAGTEKA
jgi:hypothetical protein